MPPHPAAPVHNNYAVPTPVGATTVPHGQSRWTRGWRRGTRFAAPPSRFSLAPVFALWVLLLFSPQWFLYAKGIPSPVLKLPVVTFGILILVLLFHASRLKHVYAPLMVYTAFLVLYYPFSYNPAHALPNSKQAIFAYVIAVATLTLAQRPKHVKNVLLMFLLFQYLWYGAHGVMTGGAAWDPGFFNTDGFGALMAMGLVSSLHIAMAATSSRLRWLSVGTSLLCVAGLVSSFARGAVLAAGLAIACGWIRSGRRRLAYVGSGVSMLITLVIAAGVFTGVQRGPGETQVTFWGEMATIAGDLGDRGDDDRRLIWSIARREFVDHPFFGVGVGSFGAYAAENYSGQTVGERYQDNPGRLYDRAVHNIFFQVLAEQGLVGVTLFVLLLVDFWRRNTAVRRWVGDSNHTLLPGLRIRPLAVALETSMVAFLAAGLFYNMLGNLLYLLLAANALLHLTWVRSRTNSTMRATTG